MAQPKPPVSLWIASERKRHGMKPRELSERLTAMGYEAAEGTIRVWEAGRAPRADTITALERLFGSTAPRDQATTNGDLAAALRELVEEVRLSRLAQERSAEVLAELIGRVGADRPQSGSAAAAAAPAHRGTR